MELQKDDNDCVTSKRKVNGVVRVFVNDGLKLMELFNEMNLDSNSQQMDREILGELRVVKSVDGSGAERGMKLVEESVNEKGQLRLRDIKGNVKVIGNHRFFYEAQENLRISFDPSQAIASKKNDDFEIESATIIVKNELGDRALVLECKSPSGALKEIQVTQGGMILDSGTKQLVEILENGQYRTINGIIKVLGSKND